MSQTAINVLDQNQTFRQYADSVITALSTKYKIPGGGVAITDNGKVAFQSVFGFTKVENKEIAMPNSKFRLASVTKIFTAIGVMQLVERGKINLDNPVENYLTDLKIQSPNFKNPISIRHLLTHTSGLTDDILNNSSCAETPSQQTLIALINEEVHAIQPGYIFNYSNIGYGLLGIVIERISGMSYADYVQKNIFNPLGMTSTAVLYRLPNSEKVAMGYNSEGKPIDELLMRDIAAGGGISTIEDLSRLTTILSDPVLLEQKGLLRREMYAAMCTSQTQDLTLPKDEKFGLGLFIIPLGVQADSIIGDGYGHGGDFRFHHALTMVFPSVRLGISIVSNGEEGDRFCQSLYHRLLRKYYALNFDTTGAKPAEKKGFTKNGLQNERIDHRELKGVYGGGGSGFIRIERINDQKIRFRQEKNVLVLTRNDATNRYHVRYKLLRLIPIKVKDMEFGFRKVDGNIIMKACYPESGEFEYISRKDGSSGVSEIWKTRAGAYEIVNLCSGNTSMEPTRLVIVHNKLIFQRRDPRSDITDEIGFDILDDTTAVSDGIDRGCAATLKVLPNGNLYYSGYIMRLIK